MGWFWFTVIGNALIVPVLAANTVLVFKARRLVKRLKGQECAMQKTQNNLDEVLARVVKLATVEQPLSLMHALKAPWVYLPSLVSPLEPHLLNRSFERVWFRGPAYIKFQDKNQLYLNTITDRRQFMVVEEGTNVIGAVFIFGCSFTHCHFENINILCTHDDFKQLSPAIDQMDTAQWQQKIDQLGPPPSATGSALGGTSAGGGNAAGA